MAHCPECDARLQLPMDLELWDHIYCPICEAELEVIGLNPLELEVLYDLDEPLELDLTGAEPDWDKDDCS